MSQKKLYRNLVASILKLTVDFIADEEPGATFFNWDAHNTVSVLPAGTLIGPAGCGMAHEEKGIEVVFALGAGTSDDVNNFRLTDIMSKLYDAIAPETRIAIYDQDTTLPVSWMVVKTPVAITPVTKSEIRSIQFVECRALMDLGASSSN